MRWLFTIGACAAIVGQLSVALATLAEAREGQGMGAHVEAAGTATHYAHGEECAICQARSLHGLASRSPEAWLSSDVRSTALVSFADRFIAPGSFSPSHPRAPPSTS